MKVYAIVDLFVFFCAAVVCCFGNSLVMISVRRFEYLKEPTFYFVALLAFYDFCHGAPVFVLTATLLILDSTVIEINITYEVLCRIQGFLAEFATLGDILSILIISIDRFIYINWPLRYCIIVTEKRAQIIMYIGCSIAEYCFQLFLASTTVVEKPCTTYGLVDTSGMTYVLGTFHVVVLLAVVSLYITIAVLSWKSRRSAPNNLRVEGGQMTRILVRVIGVFTVTNATLIVIHELTVNGTRDHIVWIQLLGYWIWEVRQKRLSVSF